MSSVALFALAVAAATATPAALAQVAPEPALVDEVVVIGKRLQSWTGNVKTNPFGTFCRTVKSTGDPEVDAIGCTALKRCWGENLRSMEAEMKAARVSSLPPSSPSRQAFTQCIGTTRGELIKALAERRGK